MKQEIQYTFGTQAGEVVKQNLSPHRLRKFAAIYNDYCFRMKAASETPERCRREMMLLVRRWGIERLEHFWLLPDLPKDTTKSHALNAFSAIHSKTVRRLKGIN